MKPNLLLLVLVSLLISCTNYQYLTVSGLNVPKKEKKELVIENDTLRIQYLFKEIEGGVIVRIQNKTAGPLEVDWRKSAVIINGKTLSYYDPNQSFSGQIQTASRRSFGSTVTSGDVIGQLQSGEQLQFIPPMSFIDSRPLNLSINSNYQFSDEKAKKVVLELPNHRVIYKRLHFESETSPAHFRSYITIRVGKTASQ